MAEAAYHTGILTFVTKNHHESEFQKAVQLSQLTIRVPSISVKLYVLVGVFDDEANDA